MSVVFFEFAVAAVFYAAAFAAAAVSFYKNGKGGGFWFYALAFTGFIAHSVALSSLGLKSGRLPLSNSYELLEAIAWLIVAVDFSAAIILRVKIVGSLTALIASILTVMPLFCPVFSRYVESISPVSARPDLAAAHAVIAILSYSFLALTSIFGWMYVLQIRALKNQAHSEFARGLLPLPRLARFGRRALGVACLSMSVSVILGIVAARYVDFTFVMWAKFGSGAFLFVLMLIILRASYADKISDTAFAKFCIALFIVAILILIPIQLRTFYL